MFINWNILLFHFCNVVYSQIICLKTNTNTYQLGKILKYILSVYHGDNAGRPNNPITTSRYNKSKIDNVTKSFKNVWVKFDVRRLEINTPILKMFPSTPIHETLVAKEKKQG